LENVQGDERDVIFISLTYGKDANGNFYQRFGPINRDTGWRRLNVLFTRAKEQMVVYSSMDSAMIVAGANARRGVTALKGFLSYCESGVLPETPIRTGRDPDSPFEIDVANEVENFGLKAEYQVGVAGFFVDIGVFDPREPGHYLLGIECDGATYHSSQSARDRDKIRQEILEGLGWNIYRIWSTDWFVNSATERQKLRTALSAVQLEADSRASLRESEADSALEVREAQPEYAEMELPLEAVEESIIEAQPIQPLKSRLMDLRVRMDEDFPDVEPEKSLLRDELISDFLEHRPTSLEEFHRTIPAEVRQNIDMQQARAYLSTVLMILEQ
jgi:very-short-patch-repair endonuclease